MKAAVPAPSLRWSVERLSVQVYATRAEMGAAAGAAVAAKMRQLLARGPAPSRRSLAGLARSSAPSRRSLAGLAQRSGVRVMFASAPSQNEFLAELRRQPGLDWSRVTAFHMDEYVGLGADAPQSFVRFLNQHLYDAVHPGMVHNLNGLAADPKAECQRYAALLNEAPLDIVCAGIGENGHLAFNDPPYADFDDPLTVKTVRLAQRSRQQQVHDGCFPSLDQVPQEALTVTLPAMLAAAHIFCMVPGPTKAQAVRDTLLGPVTEDCPASILRRHPAAVLYTDWDSSELARQEREEGA